MADGSGLRKTVSVEVDSKWEEVSALANASILPRLPKLPLDDGSEQELAEFFNQQRDRILYNMIKIHELMSSIAKSQAAMRKHVIPLFIVLAEQENEKQPWSSSANELATHEIIAELYRIFDMEMVPPGALSAFFFRDFKSINNPAKTTFAHLLKTFRPTLGIRDAEWKWYPAAQHAFKWILHQVKYPYMCDHMEALVLPTLNFIDDFEQDNVIFGLSCLSHIVTHSMDSYMRQSGWGMLIYEHLKKSAQIHKDAEVVDKLCPEILKILKIIEMDPHLNAQHFTLYDTTLEILLFQAAHAEADAKCVWLKHLHTYFDVIGHAVLHWNDRVLELLMDATFCLDPERWLFILKCVRICIQNTWVRPRSEPYAELILRVLINVSAHDIFGLKSEEETLEMLKLIDATATECFMLLVYYPDFRTTVLPQLTKFNEIGKQKLLPQFLKKIEDLVSNLSVSTLNNGT